MLPNSVSINTSFSGFSSPYLLRTSLTFSLVILMPSGFSLHETEIRTRNAKTLTARAPGRKENAFIFVALRLCGDKIILEVAEIVCITKCLKSFEMKKERVG